MFLLVLYINGRLRYNDYKGQLGAWVLHSQRWNSQIYARPTNAKAFAKDVFINQERKLGDRRRLETALVLTINDANQGLMGNNSIITAPIRTL